MPIFHLLVTVPAAWPAIACHGGDLHLPREPAMACGDDFRCSPQQRDAGR